MPWNMWHFLYGGLSANAPNCGERHKCAEMLLNHLGYSAAAAADVLKDFSKRNRIRWTRRTRRPSPMAERMWCSVWDAACEAELLSKLLQRLERKEANPGSGQKASCKQDSGDAGESASNVAAWPSKERGASEEISIQSAQVPEGCKLTLHRPPRASPFLQAFLPEGSQWKGKTVFAEPSSQLQRRLWLACQAQRISKVIQDLQTWLDTGSFLCAERKARM